MTAVVDNAVPDAEKLIDEQYRSIMDGVGTEPIMDTSQVVPWLSSWMPSYSWSSDPQGRYKHKAAYLRKRYTERQLSAIWKHLSDPEHTGPTAGLILTGFGGQVNAVAADATATAQRDSILRASYTTGTWLSAEDDETHIAWGYAGIIRTSTPTAVPVPGDNCDGSYISYPDTDLADPHGTLPVFRGRRSATRGNYPRIQAVKRKYDPRNVFRHALSIRPG